MEYICTHTHTHEYISKHMNHIGWSKNLMLSQKHYHTYIWDVTIIRLTEYIRICIVKNVCCKQHKNRRVFYFRNV